MKAITLKNFGGAENLSIEVIPEPAISVDEVLVKIDAFSINPVDVKTRNGKGVASRFKDHSPKILGWDFSGSVYKTGSSVSAFKKGDEVFGFINFPEPGNTYAEYVAAPESQLALKPSEISTEEAAAAPLAALTAWQVLNNKFHLKPGDKILIHSAAGGVGHYAVQMANHMAAYVTGTASEENRDFVLRLGASEHIDYRKQKFEDVLKNIDFVLDTQGGEYIDRSLKVLKPGGMIVCIPSGASDGVVEKAASKGMIGETFSVRPNGKDMRELADLMKNGLVRSFVSKIFNFDEIKQAHKHIESGKTKGKIVVSIG